MRIKCLVFMMIILHVLCLLNYVSADGLVVDTSDRAAVAEFFSTYYETAFDSTVDWTGSVASCNPGTISQSFQNDTLQLINFFRAMTGLPGNITFDPTRNAKSQAGALMMQANNRLAHTGWSSSDKCYTSDGANALLASNLATIAGSQAVRLYMQDPSIPSLGHRRWLLYPPQANMGHGSTDNYDALMIIGTWGSRPQSPEWVAWPPPGFVPYQIVFNVWSFSALNLSGNPNVSVVLDGQPLFASGSMLASGYGDNTFAWDLTEVLNSIGPGMSDTTYTVTISNLSGLSQSSYTYDLTIFDPDSAPPPSECLADITPLPDGDCKVNLSDLVIMKGEFLKPDCATNPCYADIAPAPNGDNKVNLTDLVVMKGEFLRPDCCP